jgi:hypothetical protein
VVQYFHISLTFHILFGFNIVSVPVRLFFDSEGVLEIGESQLMDSLYYIIYLRVHNLF